LLAKLEKKGIGGVDGKRLTALGHPLKIYFAPTFAIIAQNSPFCQPKTWVNSSQHPFYLSVSALFHPQPVPGYSPGD
jgi:hypothetical protein